jgi:hypothetical protein
LSFFNYRLDNHLKGHFFNTKKDFNGLALVLKFHNSTSLPKTSRLPFTIRNTTDSANNALLKLPLF